MKAKAATLDMTGVPCTATSMSSIAGHLRFPSSLSSGDGLHFSSFPLSPPPRRQRPSLSSATLSEIWFDVDKYALREHDRFASESGASLCDHIKVFSARIP